MRGFRNFSSNKLPKRAFRARPPQLFKQQASKTSVSCEASSTFQATSFQNEHFVRGLLNFSSNKLPKRTFRARPPSKNFSSKQQASKTSISCEASSTFQKQQASKTSISCEASSTFQSRSFQRSISCEASSTFQATNFQNEYFVRSLLNFPKKKLPKSCACRLSSPARPAAWRRAQKKICGRRVQK